ncbi:hypothetical protein [Sphingomonas sp.]|uniref:hypothetical protein n=1 Tax=Sphingomonas sp. TaxID=28214 RepID=UPI002C664059|nr:hypothetical protein [Sphingomonas sp.]HTG39780.1 hypothetical protein [Sphingomonas sp.]
MSDWFSTAVEMQREILRAQRAQIEAGSKMMQAAKPLAAAQAASAKAAKANLEAWQMWLDFWTPKK